MPATLHFALIVFSVAAAALAGVGLIVTGAPVALAAACAVSAFLLIGHFHGILVRARERGYLADQLATLEERCASAETRLAELEQGQSAVREEFKLQSRQGQERMRAELKVIESLLGQLSRRLDASRLRPTKKAPATLKDIEDPTPAISKSEPVPLPSHANVPTILDEEDLYFHIQDALEYQRHTLKVTPVFDLKSRRQVAQEVEAYLSSSEGEAIDPRSYEVAMMGSGMSVLISNLLLFRSVQLARDVIENNIEMRAFMTLPPASLSDHDFVSQFMEFLGHHRNQADRFVFSLTQQSMGEFDRLQQSHINELARLGFRFCLTEVTDLHIDPQQMREQNIRYLKISTHIFPAKVRQAGSSFQATDLPVLFGRYGLNLIVEQIADEHVLLDLLDHGVALGQGPVLGNPKWVRQGAERKDDLALSA